MRTKLENHIVELGGINLLYIYKQSKEKNQLDFFVRNIGKFIIDNPYKDVIIIVITILDLIKDDLDNDDDDSNDENDPLTPIPSNFLEQIVELN